ncbi:T9SS type A sorting domain-containing protein [bacterium]|nr:T9SS type A sorting domain-containing protein [bacterium]
MPNAKSAALAAVYEPPSAAGGAVTLAVRPSLSVSIPKSEIQNPKSQEWLAASFSEPMAATDAKAAGRSWDVLVASDLAGPVAVTWDNVSNLPTGYEAYLIGGPAGPVNLRKVESLPLSLSPSLPFSLTLAIGAPEIVAPFLAPPLSKENAFVYPNPGPDGTTQMMTFKWGPTATGVVSLKIFDVGGRLVKELAADAAAQKIEWDCANKHGQRLGSGVYIYILESGGDKLVDKLAIVR